MVKSALAHFTHTSPHYTLSFSDFARLVKSGEECVKC